MVKKFHEEKIYTMNFHDKYFLAIYDEKKNLDEKNFI